MVDAKPHWGLSARFSIGTIAGGLVYPLDNVLRLSMCGTLELIRPRTTVLPLGTKRSGSNVPDRASSYSRRKRSTFEGAEKFFGDGIVAAFGVPMAAIVSAAEMDREGDARSAGGLEASVVGTDGFI